MACFIRFLTDEYQRELISMAQSRAETYGEALNLYQKLFILRKNQCFSKREGDSNLSNLACKKTDCLFRDSCEKISETFGSIKDSDIEDFIKKLCDCYNMWTGCQAGEALRALEKLMEEKRLLPKNDQDSNYFPFVVSKIEESIYFRGRVSEEYLTKVDMFHVPYNRRYLIRNGRFSLTGQPLLYLCSSVLGVAEELRIDRTNPEQMKKLKVASFYFDPQKREKPLRIFDLKGDVWHIVKGLSSSDFSEATLFRNILSAVCSFPRREGLGGEYFTEQYVIPQMVTQLLHKKGYDGVCYYSTAAFRDVAYYSDDSFERKVTAKSKAYAENLAIFTNNAPEERGSQGDYKPPFDAVLFDRAEISMPISIENVREYTAKTLVDIYDDIRSCYGSACLSAQEHSGEKTETLEKMKAIVNTAESLLEAYRSTFSDLNDHNQAFNRTDAGKLHLQLLVHHFSRLLGRVAEIGKRD